MRKELATSQSRFKAMLGKKPEAEECYPFGEDVAVFKVRGKMFATFSIDFRMERGLPPTEAMNLKCEPSQALMLRDVFEDVIPGYHMNKQHWNTVVLNNTIPDEEIERMIDHSYALVVKKLKRLDRDALIAKFGSSIIEA